MPRQIKGFIPYLRHELTKSLSISPCPFLHLRDFTLYGFTSDRKSANPVLWVAVRMTNLNPASFADLIY